MMIVVFFCRLYLLVLAILNVINIIYRIVTVASFQLRISILKDYAILQDRELRIIMKNCGYGDWFILHLLAVNIDASIFNEILEEIVNQLHEVKGIA